jgi:hypothetical protein
MGKALNHGWVLLLLHLLLLLLLLTLFPLTVLCWLCFCATNQAEPCFGTLDGVQEDFLDCAPAAQLCVACGESSQH